MVDGEAMAVAEVVEEAAAGGTTVEGTVNKAADGLFPGQRWRWDGIDKRALVTESKKAPEFEQGWTPLGKSWMDVFLLVFSVVSHQHYPCSDIKEHGG